MPHSWQLGVKHKMYHHVLFLSLRSSSYVCSKFAIMKLYHCARVDLKSTHFMWRNTIQCYPPGIFFYAPSKWEMKLFVTSSLIGWAHTQNNPSHWKTFHALHCISSSISSDTNVLKPPYLPTFRNNPHEKLGPRFPNTPPELPGKYNAGSQSASGHGIWKN